MEIRINAKKHLLFLAISVLFFSMSGCQLDLTKIKSNDDRISTKTAEKLVREWAIKFDPNINLKTKFPLKEMTTDEIWDQLHAQLFRLPEEHFLGQHVFLITNKQVEPIGCSFGGLGITQMIVTDLDSNGDAELIYTDSCGSGTQLSRIGMYIFDDAGYTIIGARLIYYMGELILEKISGQNVLVKAGKYDYQLKEFASDATIGELHFSYAQGYPDLTVILDKNIPEEILKNLSNSINK